MKEIPLPWNKFRSHKTDPASKKWIDFLGWIRVLKFTNIDKSPSGYEFDNVIGDLLVKGSLKNELHSNC